MMINSSFSDLRAGEQHKIPTAFSNVFPPFLYDFQKDGVRDLLKGKTLLADEVGLGKSNQALSFAIMRDYKQVLIVCPAPLKRQWHDELKTFFNKDSIILTGSKKARNDVLSMYSQGFLIINYEQLRLHDYGRFDLIIYDEIHRLKNNKTLTYKSAKRIFSKHIIGLTATPIVNNPAELYTICKFLNPYFMSWKSFNYHHCLWDTIHAWNGRIINTIIGYKNLDLLNKKLNTMMIRRKKADVMKQLPPRTYKNYYVKAKPYQHKIINHYTNLMKNFFDKNNFENVLANFTLARMSCDSTELIKKSNSKNAVSIEKIESAKIDVLKEILEGMGFK